MASHFIAAAGSLKSSRVWWKNSLAWALAMTSRSAVAVDRDHGGDQVRVGGLGRRDERAEVGNDGAIDSVGEPFAEVGLGSVVVTSIKGGVELGLSVSLSIEVNYNN